MDCSCNIYCDLDESDYDHSRLIDNENHKAPREHHCEECTALIEPGEEHIFIVDLVFEYSSPVVSRYRMCKDCRQIVDVFFENWIFGEVLSMLRDGIIYGEIGVSEDCLCGLSTKNMDLVCGYVEEVWADEERDEAA